MHYKYFFFYWKKYYFTDITVLGIYEIKITKKYNNFMAIVTDRTSEWINILVFLEDRLAETVDNFLNKIPKRLKDTVHTVCVGIQDSYIKAIKNVFYLKKVKIVIDRFHVAKNYRKAVDELRK